MMVRKQVKEVDEQPPTRLPYPVTPLLSQVPDTETAGFALKTGLRAPISDQNTNDVWADLGNPNTVNEFPNIPAAIEQNFEKTGTRRREYNLPPSLRAGPPVLTPRSSFDSQRSTDSATNLVEPTRPTRPTQTACPQVFSSNNPWASVAGSPSKNLKAPALERQSDSLLHTEPLAKPWFDDFPAAPVQHIPSNPDPAARPVDKEGTHPFNINENHQRGGVANSAMISHEAATPLQHSRLNPGLATEALTTDGQYPFNPYSDSQDGGQGLNTVATSAIISHEGGEAIIYDGPERQELEGASPWGTSEMQKALPELPINFPPQLPPRRSMDDEVLSAPKPASSPVEQPLAPLKISPMGLGYPNRQSPEGSSLTDRYAQSTLAPERKTSARLSTETQIPAAKQRNETYQIRLVNWLDTPSSSQIRSSPIMVQNANGPCPLLALVNALTLSTPAHIHTALTETLRVREQVSLGLLLDAVIDELMSDRRGDAAPNLPDVSDLYVFLKNLHTGMNVNPSFVSSEEMEKIIIDASISEPLSNINHFREPGGFEDTREMRLYGTFGIPLIHGWIAPRNQPTFAALKRSARTYEEAQNLMFREEELEDKLHQHGLNQEEQLMLEDISSIKYFLSSSATQLTQYGLETISCCLRPGSIAILFRNDHFSTLYKHPHSGQLFTLVTDMGYAGHDEVVWESLTDVSGEGCEFFAGDFRPVGHGSGPSPSNVVSPPGDSGWTTVSRSTGNTSKTRRPSQSNHQTGSRPLESSFSPLSIDKETPQSPSIEQEDHDLALALQLQEEEEDLHRREVTARRREEDELSQAFLASQSQSSQSSNRRGGGSAGRGRSRGHEIPPLVPPRGGAAVAAHTPRKAPDDGEDAPPPTYEQAASGPAYHPPPDHPAHAHTPSANTPTRPQCRRSAYFRNSAAIGGVSPHQTYIGGVASSPVLGTEASRRSSVRRRSGPAGRGGAGGRAAVTNAQDDERKDCLVM